MGLQGVLLSVPLALSVLVELLAQWPGASRVVARACSVGTVLILGVGDLVNDLFGKPVRQNGVAVVRLDDTHAVAALLEASAGLLVFHSERSSTPYLTVGRPAPLSLGIMINSSISIMYFMVLLYRSS